LFLRDVCLSRLQEEEADEESRDRAALMQENKRSELKEGLIKGNRASNSFCGKAHFAILNFMES